MKYVTVALLSLTLISCAVSPYKDKSITLQPKLDIKQSINANGKKVSLTVIDARPSYVVGNFLMGFNDGARIILKNGLDETVKNSTTKALMKNGFIPTQYSADKLSVRIGFIEYKKTNNTYTNTLFEVSATNGHKSFHKIYRKSTVAPFRIFLDPQGDIDNIKNATSLALNEMLNDKALYKFLANKTT